MASFGLAVLFCIFAGSVVGLQVSPRHFHPVNHRFIARSATPRMQLNQNIFEKSSDSFRNENNAVSSDYLKFSNLSWKSLHPLKLALSSVTFVAGVIWKPGYAFASSVVFQPSSKPSLWKVFLKIMRGSSNKVVGSVGDSGAALKGLLNTVGQLVTLSLLFCAAWAIQKTRERNETQSYERELVKLKEYKGLFFFSLVYILL